MANCPHCSEEIASLPGFVSEDKLKERLRGQAAAKQGEIDLLNSELTESRTKSQGYDAIVTERDGFKAKIEGIERAQERTAVLSEHGIDLAGLATFETLYNSQTVDDAKSFGDWVASKKEGDPVLSRMFGSNTDAAPATDATPAATVVPAIPNTSADSAPAGAVGGAWTEADSQRVFKSPEYAALDSAGKRAKMAEVYGRLTAAAGQ